jgi:hypothetical protein
MNTNRKVGTLLACIAACGLLAACGSSSSSSSSSSTKVASAGTTGFAAARTKLEACLKQHGVTLPSRPGGFRHRTPGSGSGNGGGPPAGGFFGGGGFQANPKLRAAFKACAADFPRRGAFAGRGGFAAGGAARKAAITKFVTCVRQHGYDLPKPNFSGKGSVFPSDIRSNPKFRAASQACAKLLVPRGAPPNGAPGSGGSAPNA